MRPPHDAKGKNAATAATGPQPRQTNITCCLRCPTSSSTAARRIPYLIPPPSQRLFLRSFAVFHYRSLPLSFGADLAADLLLRDSTWVRIGFLGRSAPLRERGFRLESQSLMLPPSSGLWWRRLRRIGPRGPVALDPIRGSKAEGKVGKADFRARRKPLRLTGKRRQGEVAEWPIAPVC
jgi:hypothetical protein